MTRWSLISKITISGAACVVVLDVVWFFAVSGGSRFPPAAQVFGLLGSLNGLFLGRRIAAWEGRDRALVSLVEELRKDKSILAAPEYAPSEETPRPPVYTRLLVSATNAALTSGALAERSNDELLQRLHRWRDDVNDFNRRLELTEFHCLSSGDPIEIAKFEHALHGSESYLQHMRCNLPVLLDYITTNYPVAAEHDAKLNGSTVSRRRRLFALAGLPGRGREDWQHGLSEGGVGDTGERAIPGQDSGHDSEIATDSGHSGHVRVSTDSQETECREQRDKHRGDRDGNSQ